MILPFKRFLTTTEPYAFVFCSGNQDAEKTRASIAGSSQERGEQAHLLTCASLVSSPACSCWSTGRFPVSFPTSTPFLFLLKKAIMAFAKIPRISWPHFCRWSGTLLPSAGAPVPASFYVRKQSPCEVNPRCTFQIKPTQVQWPVNSNTT